MDLNPVIIAIPMYFTLMAVELVYESITHRKTYRLNDAVTNVSTGTLQQLTNTFLTLFRIGIYTLVYERFAFVQLDQTWGTFAVAFLMWDLCYYWEHRMAHTISLFWGGHVVHHQSEDFNLSVALRQTSTGFIWGLPFYLPMALVGIHPIQFVFVGGINLLYQFWIHTEHIGKMPRWFEAIFNTPSHHRVHHGRDPKYIDKNFAGVLIVWDRLFGTFQEEEERPHYGITRPLRSWNPVYANFAHYIDLFHTARKARSAGDVLRILFKRPGWQPAYLGGSAPLAAVDPSYTKYDEHEARDVNLYILAQFLGALAINALYFFRHASLDPVTKGCYALWILVTTLMFGFLFEHKNGWLSALEIGRLLTIPVGMWMVQQAGVPLAPVAFAAGAVFSVASTAAFIWLKWLRPSRSAEVI
ncbi:MAG: sterol desaturase family protein [Rhodothermales bacterium]